MASVLLPDRNLLFLHVPKTAGGSISRVLAQEPGAAVHPVKNMRHAEPCAIQLQRQLPKPLAEYETVTVVRNPWDWMVSGYLHVTQNAPAFKDPPSFRDFVLGRWESAEINHYPKKFTSAVTGVAYLTQITQRQHLSMDGADVRIDHLCRFESLAADLRGVFKRGLDLPHVHKSERAHYSHYYDRATRLLVAERNASLIELHGYQFESS